MNIDLLYIDGCPNRQVAAERLHLAAQRVGLPIDIRARAISAGDAEDGFQGSPTLLVGGSDLFPIEQAGATHACRLYVAEHGVEGAPTVSALEEVLSKFEKQT